MLVLLMIQLLHIEAPFPGMSAPHKQHFLDEMREGSQFIHDTGTSVSNFAHRNKRIMKTRSLSVRVIGAFRFRVRMTWRFVPKGEHKPSAFLFFSWLTSFVPNGES